MEQLRITTIQAALHWEDPAANRRDFARKIAPLQGQTDLIVLPEMFTTGFTMAAERLAEPMEGPTLAWMREQAAASGAVLTGSLIVREGAGCYNRLVWMRPDGSYHCYDKRHLFTLAGEQHHYQPGRRRLVVTWRDWKVLPLICYDLRFPVWSRNTDDYDLLLYVANWPERRGHAWRSLLTARAIENQVYTVGLNRVGTDGNDVYYAGDSMIVDYGGALRYRIAHAEDVCTIALSREAQQRFRHKLAFLPDRDRFKLLGIE